MVVNHPRALQLKAPENPRQKGTEEDFGKIEREDFNGK